MLSRGQLSECWLPVRHIISVSHLDASVFIELPRTTVELIYDTSEEAQRAARCYAGAMANEPDSQAKAACPAPVRGNMRSNRL